MISRHAPFAVLLAVDELAVHCVKEKDELTRRKVQVSLRRIVVPVTSKKPVTVGVDY